MFYHYDRQSYTQNVNRGEHILGNFGTFNSLITSLILIVISVIAIILFVIWYIEYKQQLYYINLEINRSDRNEREYWKKEKRTLWYRVLINIFR